MPNHYEKATQPTIYFIGVTTGSSSIMKVFPRWAQALGLKDAVIKGIAELDAAVNLPLFPFWWTDNTKQVRLSHLSAVIFYLNKGLLFPDRKG